MVEYIAGVCTCVFLICAFGSLASAVVLLEYRNTKAALVLAAFVLGVVLVPTGDTVRRMAGRHCVRTGPFSCFEWDRR